MPAPVKAAGTLIDYPVQVPADGGYTFTLLTREPAMMTLDKLPPATSPVQRARACNADEDAVQPTRVSAALSAGTHHVRVLSGDAATPLLLWEGPGLARQPLPGQAIPAAQP